MVKIILAWKGEDGKLYRDLDKAKSVSPNGKVEKLWGDPDPLQACTHGLYTPGKKLFDVDGVYKVTGRGIVIAGTYESEEEIKVGNNIIWRNKGECQGQVTATITGTEMPTPKPKNSIGLCVKGNCIEEIKPGAEVWLAKTHSPECKGPGDVKNHVFPILRERSITKLMGDILRCCGDKMSGCRSCGCSHTARILAEKLIYGATGRYEDYTQ